MKNTVLAIALVLFAACTPTASPVVDASVTPSAEPTVEPSAAPSAALSVVIEGTKVDAVAPVTSASAFATPSASAAPPAKKKSK